jgi:hypothetical protein
MKHRRLVVRTAAVVLPAALVLGATGAAWAKPLRTPSPTVTGTPVKFSSSRTATFTWTTVTNTTYTCSLDGSGYSACSSGTTYTNLADKAHKFVLKAKLTTPASAKASNPYIYGWTVDTVAPAAPVVNPIPNPTSNTNASVSFSDTDASVVGYTCSLDGVLPAEACTSPKTYSSLGEGSHTALVTARDAAGNTAAGSVTWVVDHTAPNIPVVVGPANPTNDPGAGVSFLVDPGSSVSCTIDGTAVPACATPWTPSPDLADGPHTFAVTATDAANNVSVGSATWVVDTVAPSTPSIVTSPALHTQATDAEVVFSDIELDVAGHTCTLDAVATACSSPFDTSGLGLGAHSFSVTASDTAGNTSPAATVSWTVDAVSGPAAFVSGPGSPTNSTHAVFDWDATDTATTGFRCELPGVFTWTACDPGTTGFPADVPGAGSWTMSVEATSDGTTWSDPVSWTWLVDLTGPVQQPNGTGGVPASSGAVTSTPTFTFTNPDPTTIAGFVCSLDGGPWLPCASGYQPNVGDGAHTLQIATVDQAGNRGGILTYTWTLDTHAPLGALAFPTPLSGPAKVTFGENVLGVTASNVRLLLAGTSTAVATVQSCLDASAHAVSCSGAVRSVVLSHASRLVPGQRYRFSVGSAIHDAAGNPASAPTTVYRALRVLQESELAVTQAWAPKSSTAAYGGKYLQARLAGAAVSYAYTGTSVVWYTATGPAMGTARVYCGSTLKATVNNYATSAKWRVPRTVTCSSTSKKNVLKVVATGLKGNKLGRGTQVVFDGVKVGRTLTATPVVMQRWGSTAWSLASGGRYAVADQTNESFSMTFRGTSVTWRTMGSRSMGKAKVYVDGVYKGTFDQFSTTTKVLSRTWKLTDKVHTLKVVATGTHRTGATGTRVVLDAITVG